MDNTEEKKNISKEKTKKEKEKPVRVKDVYKRQLISLAPFNPLETVLTDTPRRFAISLIVAIGFSLYMCL